MPIRLRLSLWFSAFFAVLLVVVVTMGYALHTRGHYDDIDHALVAAVSQTADAIDAGVPVPELLESRDQVSVVQRVYDAAGVLQRSSDDAGGTPTIDPRVIWGHPAGPAYDPVAGLAPPIVTLRPVDGGNFGLVTTQGQRWRVYVQPLYQTGQVPVGFVEGWAPLAQVDAALATYRLFMLVLSVGGLILAVVGSCLVAGAALRPIRQMTATAALITRSRDLTQRIVEPRTTDEIGQLAHTFNTMLASIAQATEAQQRFVGDASHELRAPLTAIQANLDLLLYHPEAPPDERTESLAEAEREAARLGRLVADLLTLARADAGVAIRHAPVDLDALVLDSFRIARSLAHGQTLELAPFTPVQVLGDADRLRQLLIILLDNALKYTPPPGVVTLGLACHDHQVEITMRDTGQGIDPAALPHVFERFYRADPGRGRATGGTGLGLAIARWIVTEHGGTIAIASQEGQGTTLTVSLPLLAPHSQEPARRVIVASTQ